MTKTETVDAIICYHNHQDYLDDCIRSLQKQVRHIIIVDDASDDHLTPITGTSFYHGHPVFRNYERVGPAAAFNIGAQHTEADWLLYVDPHNIYEKHCVKQMLKLTSKDDGYDCCFAYGKHYVLGPQDPWIHALGPTLNNHKAAWTFLMCKRLWTQLNGIPEPPYGHINVLMQQLQQRGVMICTLDDAVHHVVNGDWLSAVRYAYESGRMMTIVKESGYETPGGLSKVADIVRELDERQVTMLWEMVLTSVYQLGALEGLDAVPGFRLPLRLRFEWKED